MAKDMFQALDSLMRRQKDGVDYGDNSVPLPAPKTRGELPQKTSSAVEAKGAGGGDGIDSPLTEVFREYYSPPATTMSSDGIFRIRFAAIKQIKFDDAGGRRVRFDFSNVSS